jgi:hypothetical protein
MSDLTLDAAGNLYGTTSSGGTGCGSGGCGAVFELKRTEDGWREQVLYSFTGGNDGGRPQAGLIFDNAGNLYGTTAYGGDVYGDGTAFELIPNSRGRWTERVIYSFSFSGSAGRNPAAALTFDTLGILYGTTPMGAAGGCADFGCGGVFELTPQADGSWTEKTIHQFGGAPDGGQPSSGVVVDSAGNLYGVTQFGGTVSCRPQNTYGENEGCGIFYKLTPHLDGNWTETIFSFIRGGGFGIYPAGGLIFDKKAHVFGTTQAGGDGGGAVFELQHSQKNGWQENVLHILSGYPRDGSFRLPRLPDNPPNAGLVIDAEGNLFGVTSEGGANLDGIVFELQPAQNGWTERVIHNFAGGSDGNSPQAGLVLDREGHLFGTTVQGGSGTGCNGGCGTVYEVTP